MKNLVLLLTFLSFTIVGAQDFTDGDYSYTFVGNDVYLTGTTATGDITFPQVAFYEGLPKAVVGVSGAFHGGAGAGITSVTIPEGYKTFQANCFRGLVDVTSITFNDGETFGDKFCRGLSKLTTVVLPNNEITIDDYGAQLFWECGNLSSIDLGGFTSIGKQMFRDCGSLTKLTLPSTFTTFEVGALYNSSITTLIVEGAQPATFDADWAGTAASLTAYVPSDNVTDYQNAAVWGEMNVRDRAIIFDTQLEVNNLVDFRAAVQFSDREITLAPGNYNLEDDLPSGSRVINFSGSNNIIDLTGVYIQVPVGCIKEAYFKVEGNNNVIKGGEIEDVYRNGLEEVVDFSAYNQDRENLAFGLKGAAIMPISGTDNIIDGLKITVRGSYPYGYGSIYGIGADNVYGLDKRCGILVKGPRNTINNVEVQQRAFGHGIYMQGDADETVIKNTLVEGRVRPTGDLYNETNTYDLPYRSDYKMPLEDNRPIPTDEYHSLCEDAFRMYNIPGTITIDSCTAKKMRGGFRLYLGGEALVSNSTAIDCGATNYNLPSGGRVVNCSGNFTYAPLSDYRLSRNSTTAEWTILPSPNATGPHNIMDLQGSNHNIVLKRNPGPIEETDRAIVVTGNNSVIINETEYKIILEANTSGNKIFSCGGGVVVDNGTNNEVETSDNCESFDNSCPKTAQLMEAECYDLMSGIQTGESSEGGQNVGYINEGDWLLFRNIDLTGQKTIEARIATKYSGGYIEVRKGAETGDILATIPVANTGGWQNWISSSVELNTTAEGKYDIYFVFKGTRSGYLFNVNWFAFSGDALSIDSPYWANNIKVYPNPSYNSLNVSLDEIAFEADDVTITLSSLSGQELMRAERKNQSKNIQLDVSSLDQGVYFLKIENGSNYAIKRIVKL